MHGVTSDDASREDVHLGQAKQPITMLNDRVLVQVPAAEGERRSRAGILIPATAQVAQRLVWAEVAAVGPHVRTIKAGDKVLFNPEECFEVEVQGEDVPDPARAGHPRRRLRAPRRRHGAVPVSVPAGGAATRGTAGARSVEAPLQATAIDASPDQLAEVRFDADGLVAAIVQEVATREVLMVG